MAFQIIGILLDGLHVHMALLIYHMVLVSGVFHFELSHHKEKGEEEGEEEEEDDDDRNSSQYFV